MTATCEHCGARISSRALYGDLTVQGVPPRAYWHNEQIKLTTTKARFLYRLALGQGEVVETERLIALTGADCFQSEVVKTHISQLRRQLEGEGIPIKIVSE